MAVRGLLLDLEGVLYQGDTVVDGAVEAVRGLEGMGLGLRYLTNTTTRPVAAIARAMAAMGFEVDASAIFTPAAAARRLLERDGVERLHLAAAPGLAEDFAAFELVDEAPEAVVVGDLYRGFDWQRLNEIFAMVLAGARLVALHKNRYCRRQGVLGLDLGPFVAALEYGAGVSAEVVGKPAPAFFELALDGLGLEAGEALMVGDDVDADIGGAQASGLRAVQVRTGKYRPADERRRDVVADAVIDSVNELAALIRHLDRPAAG